MKKAAIIGAGAAGLTCLKSLLEVRAEVVVYEQSNQIGGLWNFDENKEDGGGPAYRSLITNTSKQMMAFSDFPFKQDVEDFPPRAEVLSYLHDYAKVFKLVPYIKFGVKVQKIERLNGGVYELQISESNEINTVQFDWVVIANGRHDSIYIPNISGLKSFKGACIHSKDYAFPKKYTGKKVLVVGSASSALDIASELSELCDEVFVSQQSTSWLVPRYIESKPYDLHLTKLTALLPKFIREKAFRKKLLKAYKNYPVSSIEQYFGSMKKPLNLEKDRFVPNDLLFDRMGKYSIQFASKIQDVSGASVVFEDGNTFQPDSIIFATGYKLNLPFLDVKYTRQEGNYIPLYHHVFSPFVNGLAMCGMCYIVGPILPALEMQGRYIAEVFSGSVSIPTVDEREFEVANFRNICSKKGVDPMRVQTLNYLDDIARKINVYPNIMKNWKLLSKLLAGPIVSARYRLTGRSSKVEIAEKTLRNE